jgi:hypothetical protein
MRLATELVHRVLSKNKKGEEKDMKDERNLAKVESYLVKFNLIKFNQINQNLRT